MWLDASFDESFLRRYKRKCFALSQGHRLLDIRVNKQPFKNSPFPAEFLLILEHVVEIRVGGFHSDVDGLIK
jgi:hypothetical protein